MAICLPLIVHTKHILRHSLLRGKEETSMPDNVPKGYFAVYVGEEQKKRFVVPISFLNEPTFLQLLSKAREEFGFDHPMGGLTIPCREDRFILLTSELEYQNRKSPYQYYKVQMANKIASQQVSQIKWTNALQNC